MSALPAPVLEVPSDKNRVPIIYTRVIAPKLLGIWERFLAFTIGGGCLSVLVLAAWLHPRAAGFGTHQLLGLAPCAFKLRTGLPCMACGMTTSFTYFAHGNLLASFYVQPMGFVLAILTAAATWVGLYIALTGRPVHRLLRFVPSRYWLMPMLAFALLAWGWKIWLTIKGLDGWH